MRSSASLLSPILRSDTQGRILAALVIAPERSYSLTELSRRAGTDDSTVLREVERLAAAGILTSSRIGRTRQIRFNSTHPIASPLREIITYGYGPLAVLPDLLAEVVGLDEAYLYGSWAARASGVAGDEPRDIDLLLIGDVDPAAAYGVAAAATEVIGREVNVTSMTRERWMSGDDGFVATLRRRPLVPVPSPA